MSDWKRRLEENKDEIICPKCRSVISSDLLLQCPICNEILPEREKKEFRKLEGILRLEGNIKSKGFIISEREEWTKGESKKLLSWIIIGLFIGIVYNLPLYFNVKSSFDIISLYLPIIFIGLIPFLYIILRNESFRKIGFKFRKKDIIFIIFGMLWLILLVIVLYLLSSIQIVVHTFFFNLIKWANFPDPYFLEMKINFVLKHLLLFFLLEILFIISTEILFRGFIRNSMITKHGEANVLYKSKINLWISLLYSLFFMIYFFPYGLYLLFYNFIFFAVLGILYDLTENLISVIFCRLLFSLIIIMGYLEGIYYIF